MTNLQAGLVVGGLVLLFVTSTLMLAENWNRVRGRPWRLRMAWVFVLVWVLLGTAGNTVVLLAIDDGSIDLLPGVEVPDALETVAATGLTALTLLLTGAGFIIGQIVAVTPVSVLVLRYGFHAAAYAVFLVLYWIATSVNLFGSNPLQDPSKHAGLLGGYAILVALYYFLLSLSRLGLERQARVLGPVTRIWILNNTTSVKLLEACSIIVSQRGPDASASELLSIARQAYEAEPGGMPVHDLDAILDIMTTAELLDLRSIIQKQPR